MNHEPQRRRRRNGAQMVALADRYAQSGLSRSQFAKNEGICLATLARCVKRARAAAVSAGGQPGRFIEVEHGARMLSPGTGSGCPQDPYRVNFGNGANLEIPSGFCFQEVACLLELLSKGGAR